MVSEVTGAGLPGTETLLMLIGIVIPDGEECPWCHLGFEPCVCEQQWLPTIEEIIEWRERVPTI